MKPRAHTLVIMTFACAEVLAQSSTGIPSKLFGITLGGIHDIGKGDKNDHGDLPIAKFAGMNTFLGHGVHYYFKPKAEYKAFPYIERRKTPSDEYFTTSFRLYLLPHIPTSVKTIDELEKTHHKWEVTTIEWSDDAMTKDAAYHWARDLCETFRVDLGVKPKAFDEYQDKRYTCTFSGGDRKFEVRSVELMRIVRLSFTREILDRKDKAVELILRKLQADDIRPY